MLPIQLLQTILFVRFSILNTARGALGVFLSMTDGPSMAPALPGQENFGDDGAQTRRDQHRGLRTFGRTGTVRYWNAYVGNLEMHGKGVFYDPRLDNAEKYPVAARTKQGQKQDKVDRISAKLPALHFCQLALPSPKPPKGAFDSAAAENGKVLFNDKAKCATCHVPPIFTEPGWNLHKAEETGIDDFQAMRSPDERYRAAPLRALWDMEKVHKGGFYHDGRFASLRDVVDHYDRHLDLKLTNEEKGELIEFLKSI